MKKEHSSAIIIIAVIVLLLLVIIMLKPQFSIAAGSGATGFNNPFAGMFGQPVTQNAPVILQATNQALPPAQPIYNNYPQYNQMENGPAGIN